MPWHELDAKLDEAEYFLVEMVRCNDEHRLVKVNRSAFLSASRSVLQYALKQAERKYGGKTWYQKQVSGHRAVRFFRSERNSNMQAPSGRPKGRRRPL